MRAQAGKLLRALARKRREGRRNSSVAVFLFTVIFKLLQNLHCNFKNSKMKVVPLDEISNFVFGTIFKFCLDFEI
jgi:hypothetical protein